MIKRNIGDTESVRLTKKDILDLLDALPVVATSYDKYDFDSHHPVLSYMEKMPLLPSEDSIVALNIPQKVPSKSSHFCVSLDRAIDYVSDILTINKSRTVRLSKIVIAVIMKGFNECFAKMDDSVITSLLSNENTYLDKLVDASRNPIYTLMLPIGIDTFNNGKTDWSYTHKIFKIPLCATFTWVFYDLYNRLLEDILMYDGNKEFNIDISEIFDSYYIGYSNGAVLLGSLDENLIVIDADPTLDGHFDKNTYSLHSISLNRFLSDSSINKESLRELLLLKDVWSTNQIYQWFRGGSSGAYSTYNWYVSVGVNSLYGRAGNERGIILHYNKWRIPLNLMSLTGDVSKSVNEWSKGFASSLSFNAFGSYCLLSVVKNFLSSSNNHVLTNEKVTSLIKAVGIFSSLFEHDMNGMNIHSTGYSNIELDAQPIILAIMAKRLGVDVYLRVDDAHSLALDDWLNVDINNRRINIGSGHMDQVKFEETIVIPLSDKIVKKGHSDDDTTGLFDSSLWSVSGGQAVLKFIEQYTADVKVQSVAKMYAILYKELGNIKRGVVGTELKAVSLTQNYVNQLLSMIGSSSIELEFGNFRDYTNRAVQLRSVVNSQIKDLLSIYGLKASYSYLSVTWNRLTRMGYDKIGLLWYQTGFYSKYKTEPRDVKVGGVYRPGNWHKCVMTNGANQHFLMIPNVFIGKKYNDVNITSNAVQLVGKHLDDFTFENAVTYKRMIRLNKTEKNIQQIPSRTGEVIELAFDCTANLVYKGYTDVFLTDHDVRIVERFDKSDIRLLQTM